MPLPTPLERTLRNALCVRSRDLYSTFTFLNVRSLHGYSRELAFRIHRVSRHIKEQPPRINVEHHVQEPWKES